MPARPPHRSIAVDRSLRDTTVHRAHPPGTVSGYPPIGFPSTGPRSPVRFGTTEGYSPCPLINETSEELDPLESFVLPGGGETGSRLHHARSVCRRAERRAVVFIAENDGENGEVGAYLNRLSDLLFTLARLANRRDGVAEENPEY